MRKLIFYKGIISTLDQFVEEFCRAAEALCIPFLKMDVNEAGAVQFSKLEAFTEDGECVAILFNNIGLNLRSPEGNYWELRKIPVYNILVDHPRNFDTVLNNPIKSMHVLPCDGNHEDFCRVFFPRVESVTFFPHGGVCRKTDILPEWKERPIEILYIGNCQAAMVYPKIPFFEDGGKAWYELSIRLLLQEPFRTTEDVILSVMQAMPVSVSDEELRILIMDYSAYVENTVRREHKLQIMRLLAESGLNVDVYGSYWEDEERAYSENIRVHNNVSPEDCIRLLAQAKIALNVQPWFKDGSHPRVFDAMLSGAICVTDKSRYLEDRFTDGEGLVFYELNALNELPEKLRYLLEHPDMAQRIANHGRIIAEERDTWKNRLETLLLIDAAKYGNI